MLNDLRAALRGLLRDRAFTLFSVLALALGLGLNGSLLVISRALFLRPAPVADSRSLLELHDLWKNRGEKDTEGSSSAFQAARDLPEVAGIGMAQIPMSMAWSAGGTLQEVQVASVSDGYLGVCGLRPFLGRDFAPGETDVPKPPALALVSHRFWQSRLQGRRDVMGRPLTLNGVEHVVIGILPKGFEGHRHSGSCEVLVPSEAWGLPPTRAVRGLADVLIRLKPGATVEQAQARLAALPWSPELQLALKPYEPLPPLLRARLSRGLVGLYAASLLVLLIGAANVLALQTARLRRRRPELALRSALGAGSSSLLRLILMENLLLAAFAGLAALGLALLSTPFLQALQAVMAYPPKIHLTFGLWTSLATLAFALSLGATLALLSYLQVRRLDLGATLKEAGARATGLRTRGLLVAGQAALALVLLSTAALCLRDLRRQMDLPLGYDLKGLYQVQIQPRKVGRKPSDLAPLLDPTLNRLRTLPGVEGVASGCGLPMGRLTLMAGSKVTFYHVTGACELLPLLGIRPLQGRLPEPGDEGQDRGWISESYARALWPGESTLGRRLTFRGKELEVAGLLSDLRLPGPSAKLQPILFVPNRRENPLTGFPHDSLLIRAKGNARAVKAQIRTVLQAELPGLPFRLDSLEDLRNECLAQPRQLLFLSSVMGSLALLLSLCGLYGLAAHLAEARRRELGIRVVLGAGPGRILAALGKGSLLPLLPGLAAGGLLSLAASRLLVSQNPGFPRLDPALLLGSSFLLALAAALATLLPALRASRVQPAEALRAE